jgi:hypothetical protein
MPVSITAHCGWIGTLKLAARPLLVSSQNAYCGTGRAAHSTCGPAADERDCGPRRNYIRRVGVLPRVSDSICLLLLSAKIRRSCSCILITFKLGQELVAGTNESACVKRRSESMMPVQADEIVCAHADVVVISGYGCSMTKPNCRQGGEAAVGGRFAAGETLYASGRSSATAAARWPAGGRRC